MPLLRLAHRRRVGQRPDAARAKASPGADLFDRASRGEPAEDPVDRHEGAPGFEPETYHDLRRARGLTRRRLEPRLARDSEHQAIDELLVQLVRADDRVADQRLELRRQEHPQRRRVGAHVGKPRLQGRLCEGDLVGLAHLRPA
ncbi:MAG: hypothetical protein DME12_09040 [Candidatus Rokuibacteriota bacterium]|nr:MAG: hypothetical protein DME12_09040 [Candidatus Rokubacteria bacterium]